MAIASRDAEANMEPTLVALDANHMPIDQIVDRSSFSKTGSIGRWLASLQPVMATASRDAETHLEPSLVVLGANHWPIDPLWKSNSLFSKLNRSAYDSHPMQPRIAIAPRDATANI